MSRLIDIDDEKFWDVLFDEACVEGKQAERIKNELEKIVAFDTEKVVEQLLDMRLIRVEQCHGDYEIEVMTESNFDDAIDIVKKGGVREE